MRKYILYYGICFLPDKNAMCLRAKSIAELIKKNNYIPVIIGFTSQKHVQTLKIDNTQCYLLPYPNSNIEWAKSIFSIKHIKEILLNIGFENIHTIIASDLKFLQINRLKWLCKNHSITLIPDILDWYIPSNDISIYNLVRSLDTYIKMNYLFKKFDKLLVVSKSLYQHFSSKRCICYIIPMTYSKKSHIEYTNKSGNEPISFIFAGNPGKYCEKERLDWILEAFNVNKMDFRLYILGVEKEEFLLNNPQLAKYTTNPKIKFLGRCSYNKTITIKKKCDFELLIRSKNRLTKFGFSTKLMESLENNVPIIATDTSDYKMFINDGIDGFICYPDKSSLILKINTILKLNRKDIYIIKNNLCKNDSLNNELYRHTFKAMIE